MTVRISKPEPMTERGLCVLGCGRLQVRKGLNAGGEPIYRALCARCRRECFGMQKPVATERRRYVGHKGSICEECGFVPVHSCQLDVDHKDGDRSNNDPNNLQTLCANCHRLKTFLSKDWE